MGYSRFRKVPAIDTREYSLEFFAFAGLLVSPFVLFAMAALSTVS
jgi:hypothetical protein